MNKTVRRLIKWIGYPVFAIVVFLVALYMSLPYDKVKQIIEDKLSADPSMEVTIGELGPAPLIGLSAERVRIRLTPKPKPGMPAAPAAPEPKAKGKGKKAAKKATGKVILLDEVKVKSGILALLSGKIDVRFAVEGLDGTMEGQYKANKKKGWSIKTEVKGLNLKDATMISDAIGLPVTGRFSGDVDLKVTKNNINTATGSIQLQIDKCTVGDGKKKLKIPGNAFLKAGLTMPRINVGKLGGLIKVQKGQGTFQKFQSKSSDMELALEGKFALRKPAGYTTADAYLRFKIDPALKKKHAVFELLEGQLRSAKRSDGFFGMRITGIVKNLKVKPSRVGPGKGGPRMAPGPGGMQQRFRTFQGK